MIDTADVAGAAVAPSAGAVAAVAAVVAAAVPGAATGASTNPAAAAAATDPALPSRRKPADNHCTNVRVVHVPGQPRTGGERTDRVLPI